MILIAHRGNTEGPKPDFENNPVYIENAISEGYDVEIDLRMHNGKLYLGHDEPQYEIGPGFLFKSSLWIHCKDRKALEFMVTENFCNFFWHDTDNYTMTSKGFVWAYPGKHPVANKCIMVMPELFWKLEDIPLFNTYGVCSDYVKLLNT